MGTPVLERPGGLSINGQAAMALALLSAWEEKRGEEAGGPTLQEVSRRVASLLDQHIDVHDLGLRKVPGGVYSQEVETFVGHLLAEGLATHRSPLRLTPEGEKLLRMIVRVESEAHADTVRLAARLLAVDPHGLF
jgi:hypothetical protein